MALISFSIDSLLPATAAIQNSMGVSDTWCMQYVLTAYMAGFGIMQLVYGLTSDIFGRRPVLLAGLLIYTSGSMVAALACQYDTFLLARVVQGMGAAAARVLTDAIIRDRYSESRMAQILSITMTIFIAAQISSPIVGQIALVVFSWRAIVFAMVATGSILTLWVYTRLAETAPRLITRRPYVSIVKNVGFCLKNREFVGYALAMAFLQAALLAYLGSSTVLFGPSAYNLGAYFGLAFGVIAIAMGIASTTNSALVMRYGVRRVAHSSLLGFVASSLVFFLISTLTDGRPSIEALIILFAVTLAAFSLAASNLAALAMNQMGSVAGAAASLLGGNANILGASLGFAIGVGVDGFTSQLSLGFVGLGTFAVIAVTWAESGRLFGVDKDLRPY